MSNRLLLSYPCVCFEDAVGYFKNILFTFLLCLLYNIFSHIIFQIAVYNSVNNFTFVV